MKTSHLMASVNCSHSVLSTTVLRSVSILVLLETQLQTGAGSKMMTKLSSLQLGSCVESFKVIKTAF